MSAKRYSLTFGMSLCWRWVERGWSKPSICVRAKCTHRHAALSQPLLKLETDALCSAHQTLGGDPHAFLRRFLVARSWDKERAFAQAKAAIEWREKTNASTLLVSLSLSRAHVQRMRTAYGSGPIGFDRCGHVTCLNRIGMANFNELLEINEAAGNAEEGQFCAGMDTSSFTRMSCHVQEYMAQRVFREATSAAEGYARTRMTVITDLKGLSFLKVMGQLPSIISVIKEISVVMQGCT